MKDPEFIALRNKFLGAILVAIIFVVPLFFFIYKTYDVSESDVLTMIKQDKNFTLLITDNECSDCDIVDDIMEENNIGYFVLNRSKDKHYEEIMIRLNLNQDVELPIIAYIENGEMKSYLVEVTKEKEILTFLESYNIVK